MHLFAAATREGGIRQYGEITVINFGDTYGAMTVLTADLCRVRRIAETEPASFIQARDVRQFADIFETRITRPGARIETSGRVEDLLRVAQYMYQASIDYNSWNFPRVIKMAMRQRAFEQMNPVAQSAA